MGPTVWIYVEPYGYNARSALRLLREQVFEDQDYHWESKFLGPRPPSLESLDEAREEDEFWEIGTHSILDVDRLIAPEADDEDGTVRELKKAEAFRTFGLIQPTRERFDAVRHHLALQRLWSSNYQLLYRDGAPDAIAFWGVSGH